jgi:hypothetical protein
MRISTAQAVQAVQDTGSTGHKQRTVHTGHYNMGSTNNALEIFPTANKHSRKCQGTGEGGAK